MLERKHLKCLSSVEILTFFGDTQAPQLPSIFSTSSSYHWKMFPFLAALSGCSCPSFILRDNDWQGSGGGCPCASPCSPSGHCPWVGNPCGSQPHRSTSTQLVATVVRQWQKQGAAFHLAASAGGSVSSVGSSCFHLGS